MVTTCILLYAVISGAQSGALLSSPTGAADSAQSGDSVVQTIVNHITQPVHRIFYNYTFD